MPIHRLLSIALTVAAGLSLLCGGIKSPAATTASADREATYDAYRSIYESIGAPDLCYDAFSRALAGYERIASRKRDILVVIDYSKPSTQERLYVIDIPNKKLLYKSLVAHGRGSGGDYATSFSNAPGSHKSSLGFYLTGSTYHGRNGFSMRLIGLEEGINDKAYERAIVMHGADYCERSFIASAGRLGRSFGCPALPKELNEPIINTVKEGAVLFIYAEDGNYSQKSPILAQHVAPPAATGSEKY